MFRQIDNVTLQLREEPTPTVTGSYEVLLAGERSRIYFPAQVIEAVIQVDKQRLLFFLTDDVPYEEILIIALVDINEGIKETVTLGDAYQTGSFSDLRLHPNAVEFSFIGDTTWRVEIPDRPFLKFPFTGDPRGISRPLAFMHYIKVTASPAPARTDGRR